MVRHSIIHFHSAQAKERVGVDLVVFTADLNSRTHRLGIYWSIENPASSRIWEFDHILQPGHVKEVFTESASTCVLMEQNPKGLRTSL